LRIEEPERFKFREDWLIYLPRTDRRSRFSAPEHQGFSPIRRPGRFARGGDSHQGRGQHQHRHHHAGGQSSSALPQQHPAISEFVFSAIDEEFTRRAQAKGGGIVVGGENYGQGSSREHAALAPRYLGVRSRSPRASPDPQGQPGQLRILPLVFERPADYDSVAQGDRLTLPGVRQSIAAGANRIRVMAGDRPIETRLEVSERQRAILLAEGS